MKDATMSSERSRLCLLVNYGCGGSLSSYDVIYLVILYTVLLSNKDVTLISVP
jgi:hypothetical protein